MIVRQADKQTVVPTPAAPPSGVATLTYVVITPARNEAKFIIETLKSMVAQTRLPLRWVIVSDGSTDGTDDVVRDFAKHHDWIELLRLPEQRDRSFAAKVDSFEAGFSRVSHLPFDLVASLDADISFEPGYFEFLIGKFIENPSLGVGGTPFVEGERHYNYEFANIEHVSGACQVFRRRCYAEIGGYLRIKGGGIDWTAVTTARMRGWKTRTFTEKTCCHLRPMGTGQRKWYAVDFHHGQRDYYLGGHPLWQLFRSLRQMGRRPYGFAGAALLLGYGWAWVRGVKRPVSDELVRFHRAEQIQRLRIFFRLSPSKGISA
jgi:biofilm PGA synthesis N-glycosyltransferase PgaC